MTIHKQRITPDQIDFLRDPWTLYTCDFRATAESMEYNIPAMWKYENMLPWILYGQHVTVNDNARLLKYRWPNTLINVVKNNDPKKSIYSRLKKSDIGKSSRLWVSVPHPDADSVAKRWKLQLNEKYIDFLNRNDKRRQKLLLGNRTPQWEDIHSEPHLRQLQRLWKRGFVKRAQGSGGFAVFPFSQTHTDNFLKLFRETKREWFIEREIRGSFHSIQLVTEHGRTTVFGMSDQIMDDQHYIGSKIRPLKELNTRTWATLQRSIFALRPLWKDYTGFWGIDYVIDRAGRTYVLEANIRQTAATIPTLLNNLVQGGMSTFREDVKVSDQPGEVPLAYDLVGKTADVMQFMVQGGSLGSAAHISLKKCTKLGQRVGRHVVKEIEAALRKSVSLIVKKVHYDFWPFGWTIAFILADSHCVVSAWYLEKRVLIDVFSCSSESDFKIFGRSLTRLFGAKQNSIQSRKVT